jgi:hypothetical protein
MDTVSVVVYCERGVTVHGAPTCSCSSAHEGTNTALHHNGSRRVCQQTAVAFVDLLVDMQRALIKKEHHHSVMLVSA